MAAATRLEFQISVRDLIHGKILVPRVALTDADFLMERLPDGRKNWILSDPGDKSSSNLRISSLSVTNGHPIEVRCGAVAFDVKGGKGQSTLFDVDTEETEITGAGNFDLKDEIFAVEVSPKPKKPSILSLRTPVWVEGTFRHPDWKLEKGPLLLKAGAAVALAVLNPLAALLPLIEPGPGETTNCSELLKSGKAAASNSNLH